MKIIDDQIRLHDKVALVFSTQGSRSHFFGYYDKSPFCHREQRLLCHAVDFDGRMVQAGDRAEIGFWDLASGSYTPLGETRALNWQQGSMLQWLPGSHDTKVIFNDRDGDHFAAVILDLSTGRRCTLPTTIYALTPNGQCTLTPRFERLFFSHPSYSYQGIEQPQWGAHVPAGDGILRMNLQSGDVELTVETSSLAAKIAGEAFHFVEHIMINPEGSKCIFFHRWTAETGSRMTRLYACNLDGTDLCMYPDSGYYSHANWTGTDNFIIWGRPLGAYARVRRSTLATRWILSPFLRFYRRHWQNPAVAKVKHRATQDSFLLGSVNSQTRTLKPIGKDILLTDGHPSVCPSDPQLLLTDTYDDDQNYRYLVLYDLRDHAMIELGRFFSPPWSNQTGYRCDLHPRWSPSGKRICIDTFRGERRQMLVLDVTEVLRECAAANSQKVTRA